MNRDPTMLHTLLDLHHADKMASIVPYLNFGGESKPITAKERTKRKARRKQAAASKRKNRGR